MKTLLAVLALSLFASPVRAERVFSTDADFLAACSDAAHEAAEKVQASKQHHEKITGTMPDPHSLKIEGLEACDKEAALRIPSHYAGPSIMMVTESSVYYYSEDCDICASLDACDLKTKKFRPVRMAHSISCSDLDEIRKTEKVLFDSCKR